jgi:hypothetical protein
MTDSKAKPIIVRKPEKQIVQPLTPEQKRQVLEVIDRIEADTSCVLFRCDEDWIVDFDLGQGFICAKVTVDLDFATLIKWEGIKITAGQANAVCDEYFNVKTDEPRYEEVYDADDEDSEWLDR